MLGERWVGVNGWGGYESLESWVWVEWVPEYVERMGRCVDPEVGEGSLPLWGVNGEG